MSGGTPRLDLVRRFAFPRFPGGEGERRAADEVARELEAAGLAVTVEPFEACREVVPRMRRRLHAAVAAAVLLQGFIAEAAPLGATAIGLATILFVARTGRWSPRLEEEFDREPRIASRNVVGHRPAPDPDAVTLVLLAHVDSKSARLPTGVTVGMVLFALAVVAALAVGGAVAAASSTGALPPGLAGGAGVLAALALLAAARNPSGDESPGAMDNASGLAILIDAARDLPADPALAGLELVFLATGAEEIGLAGSVRWIQRHAAALDPARTVFVNVDSVGVGSGLLAVDVRGRAPDGRSMGRLLRSAGRAAGIRVRGVSFLPGVGVDSMPPGARGFATVSLLGEVLGAAGRRIHTRRDTMEPLREKSLAAAAAVVREIARETAGRG